MTSLDGLLEKGVESIQDVDPVGNVRLFARVEEFGHRFFSLLRYYCCCCCCCLLILILIFMLLVFGGSSGGGGGGVDEIWNLINGRDPFGLWTLGENSDPMFHVSWLLLSNTN